MELNNFRKEMKIELLKRDMTLASLCQELGFTRQYLHQVIHGKRKGTDLLNKISDYLEIEHVDR